MDDRRILAEIERRLARDDPELTSLMDALNYQFPDDQDDAHDRDDDVVGGQLSWRWKAVAILAVLALVGLLLAAILTTPPPAQDNREPSKSLAPAGSVHTQRTVIPDAGHGGDPHART
jgi:hypothetical protein